MAIPARGYRHNRLTWKAECWLADAARVHYEVLGKMNEADALLQCVLRSLQQRSSSICNGVSVFLYDEITVLKKAVKEYSKTYEQIDRYALEVA